MEVRCDHCQTECKLEDAKVADSGGTVRCSDCGHTIVLGRSASVAPPADSAPGFDGEWAVETSQGRILRGTDVATLHRWIIEHRVTREDRIARGGQGFQRFADLPELAPFFDVADSAERARRADTPAPLPLPAPPPAAGIMAVVAAPAARATGGAYAEADDSTQTRSPRPLPWHGRLPFRLLLTTLVATLVAYAGIALQQWYSRSHASLPAASLNQMAKAPAPRPPPATTPPAPAAEIEPLAPVVEPPAEPEDEAEVEPESEEASPSPAPSRRKARAAARQVAARASKASTAPAGRAKAAAGGPSPQIAAAQGYAALGRRQFPQAIELFKQALAGAPSNGTALFGLAEAYRESGKRGAALKAYRRYVQMLPSGPDAGRARLHIRQLETKK